jgi:hypothetical protein
MITIVVIYIGKVFFLISVAYLLEFALGYLWQRNKNGMNGRMFCPVNSLVVTRNWWLVLLSKIRLVLTEVKPTLKI